MVSTSTPLSAENRQENHAENSDNAAEVARLAAGYTNLQRMLEISGVTLFFGLTAVSITRMVTAAAHLSLSGWAVAGIVAAAALTSLLFADLASGVVHWAADNWGHADWPLVGAAFIRPFRLHHLDAKDITRHTWLELNGNNCIASMPTFAASLLLLDISAMGLFWSAFWLGVAFWVMGTNQFHAWAHTDEPPALVQRLQKYRLILSTPHHEMHHALPHNRNYCITNGWLNAPLRGLKIFEMVEWSITKITAVDANHHNIRRAHPSK